MPIKKMKWAKAVQNHKIKDEQILTKVVEEHGAKKWAEIAKIMHESYSTNQWSSKQCHQRWNNHLRQDLLANNWSQDQDLRLINLQIKQGNKWAKITSSFPGKSVNNVKNRFYALGRRSLRRMCKFTGTIAKKLNAQSIKPSTFSRIFVSESNECEQWAGQPLQNLDHKTMRQISKYLLEFMDDKDKNFKTLKEKYSVGSIKHVIQLIFSLNDFYEMSAPPAKQETVSKSENGSHEIEQLESLGIFTNAQGQFIDERWDVKQQIRSQKRTKPFSLDIMIQDFAINPLQMQLGSKMANLSLTVQDYNSNLWPTYQNMNQSDKKKMSEKNEGPRDIFEIVQDHYMTGEYDSNLVIRFIEDSQDLNEFEGLFQI